MSAGKPARVAIAGAGIGGLSAALSLIRTPGTGVEHVTIFEPREGLDKSQGAALNVSGGAAILLREYGIPLRDIANPMVTVVARSTGGRKLFEVDIEQAINGVPAARELLYHDGRPTLMTVMRDELQRLLTEALGDNVEIRRGKDYRVTGVQSSKDGARFMLANGERTEEYDLVIGADGLGSAVRPHVSGSTEKAKYTGFRILWGVAPDTQMTRGRLEQWFGDGGYGFRYTGGPKGKENEMLVLSFKDSEMAAENEVYARGTLKDDFRKRLLKTGMPQSIFDLLDRCDRFIETGVYSHQVMKKWSKDGVCTLVGDSGKLGGAYPFIPHSYLSYSLVMYLTGNSYLLPRTWGSCICGLKFISTQLMLCRRSWGKARIRQSRTHMLLGSPYHGSEKTMRRWKKLWVSMRQFEGFQLTPF